MLTPDEAKKMGVHKHFKLENDGTITKAKASANKYLQSLKGDEKTKVFDYLSMRATRAVAGSSTGIQLPKAKAARKYADPATELRKLKTPAEKKAFLNDSIKLSLQRLDRKAANIAKDPTLPQVMSAKLNDIKKSIVGPVADLSYNEAKSIAYRLHKLEESKTATVAGAREYAINSDIATKGLFAGADSETRSRGWTHMTNIMYENPSLSSDQVIDMVRSISETGVDADEAAYHLMSMMDSEQMLKSNSNNYDGRSMNQIMQDTSDMETLRRGGPYSGLNRERVKVLYNK